jgi:hypothetical protein
LEQQEVEEQEEKQAVIEEERTEKEASARKVLSESLGIKNELAIDPSLVHAVVEARDPERELQERLEQNNRWMAELMAWQDIRVRRGQVDVVDPRENEIGEWTDSGTLSERALTLARRLSLSSGNVSQGTCGQHDTETAHCHRQIQTPRRHASGKDHFDFGTYRPRYT